MTTTALCLWACLHLDLSIGAHTINQDDPEIVNLDNPIGQVELSYTFTEKSPISIGYQHSSSIVVDESGGGFNYFFIKWRVK